VKTPLLAPDEDRDEDELPDEAYRERRDQRLRHRHVAVAAEPVLERGRDEPGERRHRQSRGRPDREDRASPVLRNLHVRDRGVDWPTPDDIDLYVYRVESDGSLTQVGSGTNFVLEKEEAVIEAPAAGEYVLRVENFASVTTTFTVTAGLYAIDEQVTGGIVESYTLTCERPNGAVLETVKVAVDRGGTKKVNLNDCTRRFAR
jgi:hypothetical protein